jgi:hypothetical protein
MTQVREKSFNAGNRKENSTEDVQVFCTYEVIDCLCRIICADDSRIVGYDVDYSSDEKSCEPETDDGSKHERDVFRTEPLHEELNSTSSLRGVTRTTMIAIEIGTMELLRLGAGTAIPEISRNVK